MSDTDSKTFITDGKWHTFYLEDPIPRNTIVQVRITAIPKFEISKIWLKGCSDNPTQEIRMVSQPRGYYNNHQINCLVKIDWTRRIFYKIKPIEYKHLQIEIIGHYM